MKKAVHSPGREQCGMAPSAADDSEVQGEDVGEIGAPLRQVGSLEKERVGGRDRICEYFGEDVEGKVLSSGRTAFKIAHRFGGFRWTNR